MSRHSLNTFALTLLITGAIDSIRNLPASALFGSTLIIFLIPAALVSAELASNIPEKGGIYHWVKLAFGEKIAFLATWLQWINTIAWFQTILSFIAGTAAYLIDPALAQNKYYLVSVILIVFWSLTLVSLKGVHISSRFARFFAMIGFVIPIVFILALLFIWLLAGKPLQIHLNESALLPNWQHMDNWVALTAIMTAFLGMELATVHIKEVANPQ